MEVILVFIFIYNIIEALELIQELLKHFPIRRVTALEDQELELLGKLNEWNATVISKEGSSA